MTGPTRKQARSDRRRDAFTLVETLISLLLIVAMAVGIIALLNFNYVYQNQQELRAAAADVLAREMELLKREWNWEIWDLYPRTRTVSDSRTPNNPYDDTVGKMTIHVYDRNGTELFSEPAMSRDRVRVVVRVEWRGRGRMSGRTFHETLVGFFPYD